MGERQQEAVFLHRALGRVLDELETETMRAAIIRLRNGQMTDRDAMLVLTRVDALRGVRDRIQGNMSEEVGDG